MVYLLIPRELKRVEGFELILNNVPNGLRELGSIISKYSLDIYYIETCFKTEDGYCLFMVIDFTKGVITPEELLEEFRRIEYVGNAIISPRFKNVVYPSRLYPIDLGGVRGIIIAEANMEGIIRGIENELGKKIGDTFLFRIGYATGKEFYKLYGRRLNIADINESIKVLEALGLGAKWLELKEHSITDNKIILRIDGSWECEILKGKTDKPASNYIRGLFTGFLKELLKREVEVRETKCIAVGDPYCEFEVTIS